MRSRVLGVKDMDLILDVSVSVSVQRLLALTVSLRLKWDVALVVHKVLFSSLKPTNNHIQTTMRQLIFCLSLFFLNYSLSSAQGNVKLPEQGKTFREGVKGKKERGGGEGRSVKRGEREFRKKE